MDRIRNALAAQGQPPQTIETLGAGFVLIMKEPAAGGKDKDSDGEAFGKSSVKSSVKIIELISNNPTISIPEIAQQIGKTTRAVEKQIAKLKSKGSIKRIGPAKGGSWEVVGLSTKSLCGISFSMPALSCAKIKTKQLWSMRYVKAENP
jgi:ATP-dependent DNA helicase RecG